MLAIITSFINMLLEKIMRSVDYTLGHHSPVRTAELSALIIGWPLRRTPVAHC